MELRFTTAKCVSKFDPYYENRRFRVIPCIGASYPYSNFSLSSIVRDDWEKITH